MGRPQLFGGGTLFKRLRQAVYLGSHPLSHLRCASIIRESRLARDWFIPMKYLGNHLALSLRAPQRRQALMGHYTTLPKLLQPSVRARLGAGILIWQKLLDRDCPPLSVILEPSKLAPMEGELQLRFSYRSDLCVLTFLLAPGRVFEIDAPSILFIGGVQGRFGSREEMREASRLNGEISPAAMLILAVQAIAKIMQVDELVAIGEDDHISMSYSPSKVMFDYRLFWTQAGGIRRGEHYRIPLESPQKPLLEIPLSHRGRTKRKREAKRLVRAAIERRLRQIIVPALDAPATAIAAE
ncbi:MAG: DUF535 family protein [Sphingomicrobium sp.]